MQVGTYLAKSWEKDGWLQKAFVLAVLGINM